MAGDRQHLLVGGVAAHRDVEDEEQQAGEEQGHGETVTVVAFPARDGTQHLGFMTKLTFPDGHFFQFAAEGTKT